MGFWDWFKPKPKPPIVVLPPDPRRYCRVSVFAAAGGLAPVIGGTLRFDDPTWDVLIAEIEGGRLKFTLPKAAQYGWQVHLTAHTADQAGAWDVVLAPDIDVAMGPAVPLLTPLRVNGQFFTTADGQPQSVIGCSSFKAWRNSIVNEPQLTAMLRQRVDLGFTELRIWGMWSNDNDRFDPRPHLTTLRPFMEYVGTFGLRVQFTVFPDVKRVMPVFSEQRWWFDQIVTQLRGLPNVMIEGMNEGDYLDNEAEGLRTVGNPVGILWSRGSCIQDSGTFEPVGHFGTYHPARGGDDWPRRVGHNAMETADVHHVPITSNECKRPDEDGYHADRFFDAAANGALLCAGSTFHTLPGEQIAPFTGGTLACAEAWVRGAKAVPLMYQRGQYTAGHLAETPLDKEGASRIHAKIVGNQACAVVSGREPGYVPKPKNGWSMVRQQDSVIELTR